MIAKKSLYTIYAIMMFVMALAVMACGNDDEDDGDEDQAQKIVHSWILQEQNGGNVDVLTFTADGHLVRSVLKNVDDVFLRYDESDVPCVSDGYTVRYVEEGDTVSKTWVFRDGVLLFDGLRYLQMDGVWRANFEQAVLTTSEGINYNPNGTLAPDGQEIYGNWSANGYTLSFFTDGRVSLTVSSGKYRDVFHGTFKVSSGYEMTFTAKQELQENYTWSGEQAVQGSGHCEIDLDDMHVNLRIGNDEFGTTYRKMY
ncbi:MAG: hypothetical protein IJ544_07545 [Prevotella sp.]|nr:hypothetical protein [Prevotella sp.]